MTLDALATERHFIDHLAPVWLALPPDDRGAFWTIAELAGHARGRGIEAIATLDPYRAAMPGSAPVVVASYGDLKRLRRWRPGARVAFMEHGAGQSYGGDPRTARHHSYAGGEDRDDVELFLTPNDHAAGRWREAYPAAAVAIVGSPILDTLPALEVDRQIVAIGFHWDCTTLGATGGIGGPGGRVDSPETGSALRDFVGVLGRLARSFEVIGTGHPRRTDLAGRYRVAGIRHVADFRDVCREASLYICDNSSTLFEFAALDRPVVALNARKYRRDVAHGLRFYDAVPGPMVDRPEDLVATVRAALEDPPEFRAERAAAIAKVYQPVRGGALLAAAELSRWSGIDTGAGARISSASQSARVQVTSAG